MYTQSETCCLKLISAHGFMCLSPNVFWLFLSFFSWLLFTVVLEVVMEEMQRRSRRVYWEKNWLLLGFYQVTCAFVCGILKLGRFVHYSCIPRLLLLHEKWRVWSGSFPPCHIACVCRHACQWTAGERMFVEKRTPKKEKKKECWKNYGFRAVKQMQHLIEKCKKNILETKWCKVCWCIGNVTRSLCVWCVYDLSSIHCFPFKGNIIRRGIPLPDWQNCMIQCFLWRPTDWRDEVFKADVSIFDCVCVCV